MRIPLGFFLGVTLAGTMAGCGSLNTIRYHAPSIEAAGIETESARNGLAFAVGAMCLHVAETGTIEIQPRAMTLTGLPVIPISLTTDKSRQTGKFEMALWLIPERGNTEFTFDVPRIELELDDGFRVQPSTIEIRRYRTRWEKERMYMFKPDMIEAVAHGEDWGLKPLRDFVKPIDLWDWTRIDMLFNKPAATSTPAKLHVLGLLRSGTIQDLPTINFTFVSETRQAFPGRFADGTWMGDWPDRACRKLQKHERTEH